MLILDASTVGRFYGMADAFRCVREAAIAHASGRTDVPPRGAMTLGESDTELLVMPGVVDQRTFGLKVWYTSAAPGTLAGTAALVLLAEPELGEVLLDGSVITDLRTGAMTGLAAERLAPPGAEVAGIVGTGIQARTQAIALVHALPDLRTIRVTSRHEGRRRHFAAALQAELVALYPGRVVHVEPAATAEETCVGAGVVVAATTSTTPVVRDEWIQGDVLVCGVGSHAPDAAELEEALVSRAGTVVVDTRRGGLDGAGDVQSSVRAGALRREQVIELGELLSSPPQSRPGGVSVFKSVGFSAADVVSARDVAARAVAAGAGFRLDLHA
jgi:ornithine cyclodeaminase/alanine dehydrogenase-like protein (mu-crystallin family)